MYNQQNETKKKLLKIQSAFDELKYDKTDNRRLRNKMLMNYDIVLSNYDNNSIITDNNKLNIHNGQSSITIV